MRLEARPPAAAVEEEWEEGGLEGGTEGDVVGVGRWYDGEDDDDDDEWWCWWETLLLFIVLLPPFGSLFSIRLLPSNTIG